MPNHCRIEPRAVGESMSAFLRWRDLLRHVDRRQPLLYLAPLDAEPCAVHVRRMKGSKALHVAPKFGNGFDPFEADVTHLDRFRRVVSPEPELDRVAEQFAEFLGAVFAEGVSVDVGGFLERLERKAIVLAMTNSDSGSQAARLLGFTRDKLRYRVRHLGAV